MLGFLEVEGETEGSHAGINAGELGAGFHQSDHLVPHDAEARQHEDVEVVKMRWVPASMRAVSQDSRVGESRMDMRWKYRFVFWCHNGSPDTPTGASESFIA